MPRSHKVVEPADALFESPELYQPVAHHVGVRRQALPHALYGVAHHLLPVFLLQVRHLQPEPVLASRGLREFDVLLSRARRVLALHADADIVEVGAVTLLTQQVYHYGAVHSARRQYCDVFHEAQRYE